MVSCWMEKKRDVSVIAENFTALHSVTLGDCLDSLEFLMDSTESAERRVRTGIVGIQRPQVN